MISYVLYYWPGIQGRGEFIRLALEDAGKPYIDIARTRGVAEIQAVLQGADEFLPFAPPFLRIEPDGIVLAQVANILHYIAPRLGLIEDKDETRAKANQLQLTIADFVSEIHDTHHPISNSLYYEEQIPEAKRRTEHFLKLRVPKFLSYFEGTLSRRNSPFLMGAQLSYVDLSLFQVLAGLEYAFPRAFGSIRESIPRSLALAESVKARPRLAAYLASERRLVFSQHDLFRHYPELDI